MTEITKATACFRTIAGWEVMWVLAAVQFMALKLLVLMTYHGKISQSRELAFLFLWPGMDPAPFAGIHRGRAEAVSAGIASGVAMFLLGTALLWGIAPQISDPTLTGWIGMAGIVCLLHFGLFHLIAVLWQESGVPVRPLMGNPFGATSLTEFWGERWNRAFSDFAYRVLMRPLTRRHGRLVGTMAAFGFSGLAHELVISVPARAGYGLPMLYFLIQGTAVLLEKSKLGRRLGLARGMLGVGFTMAVVLLPVCWLFHPPFLHKVITPFIHTIQSP